MALRASQHQGVSRSGFLPALEGWFSLVLGVKYPTPLELSFVVNSRRLPELGWIAPF
jgi:hypothetical protein